MEMVYVSVPYVNTSPLNTYGKTDWETTLLRQKWNWSED